MSSIQNWHRSWMPLAAGVLLLPLLLSVNASAGSSKPAAPSKPASAPKPAAPSHPASRPGGAGGSTAGHGPSTGSTTHSGPTTSTHTGPTTGNPGGHTTTTTTGGAHSTTTAGGTHTSTTGGTHTTTGGTHTATPGGTHSEVRPGGTHTGSGAGGNRTATGHAAPAGSKTVATKNGAVTKRPNGKVSDVHDTKRGMDVHHGLNGSKRVSVERPDHSRVVAERGRPGYVERRYSYHGHEYGRREYYWHGHEYNRYYRGYYYGGVYMNVYAPGFYYAPAFYGWAYNPWYAPISYGWGWGANPWYGYYGFYFAPYPVYAAPSLWLTDYLISTELAAAYAAQQEAHTEAVEAAAAGGQPLLTPEVKAQIAEEVKAQIALENSEAQQNKQGQEPDPASSGITRMFSDGKSHVFVAGGALDVVDSNGAECALSDGDALQLAAAPPADATDASLVVLSSKGGKECARAATVTVAVSDLQEMQNHMRETIDQGLQELQSKQGKGGLPAAPPSATAAPAPTAFSQAAPPAEANGAADVNQQLAEADKAEQEAAADSPQGGMDGSTTAQAAIPPPAAPPATVNIAVGQTIDQVTASLGAPISIIDLGAKKIYKYKDMKITFRAGKVSDVE
jgi:hypothetical protein